MLQRAAITCLTFPGMAALCSIDRYVPALRRLPNLTAWQIATLIVLGLAYIALFQLATRDKRNALALVHSFALGLLAGILLLPFGPGLLKWMFG
jgi:hypothetical protein